MSTNNRSISIVHVFDVEGGYSNHPADGGGPTKYGITQATLSRHLGRAATVEDVRVLDSDLAELIYEDEFWDPLRCDELPGGVDLFLMDAAVHAGGGQATVWLQRAINREREEKLPQAGYWTPLLEDGVLGSKTIAAANACRPERLIRRMAFLRIMEAFDDPDDVHFARGWVDRVLKTVLHAAAVVEGKLPLPRFNS